MLVDAAGTTEKPVGSYLFENPSSSCKNKGVIWIVRCLSTAELIEVERLYVMLFDHF